eukprot:scaffold368_cov137-Skeletonema_marinoi.AAC.2
MQKDQEFDVGEMKGFTIRCRGDNNEDEDVVVSDADAQVMANKCEYFQNVFAHGTREAEERVILKPDWASSTVKQLVQILTTGKTFAYSRERESFYLLEEAAQQILLNILFRAPAFVAKGQHAGFLNRTQIDLLLNTTEQLNGPKVEVEFEPYVVYGIGNGNKPISIDDWLTLLNQGIAIKKSDELASSFEVVSETSPPEEPSFLNDFFGSLSLANMRTQGPPAAKAKRYHLQASSSTVSIGKMLNVMCQILHRHRAVSDVRVNSQEEFSLRLPCNGVSGIALERSIKLLSSPGLKVKLHKGNSLGYFLGGSNSFSACPTITGTLPQIQAVLSVIPEDMMETYSGSAGNSALKWCSLRVSAPCVETLDRLVRAVGACQDNPDTLGVDVRSKAFFAVKSVSDMKLLLAAMINGGSDGEDGADKVPTLLILEQPKGIF